jgi:hypothetical protein
MEPVVCLILYGSNIKQLPYSTRLLTYFDDNYKRARPRPAWVGHEDSLQDLICLEKSGRLGDTNGRSSGLSRNRGQGCFFLRLSNEPGDHCAFGRHGMLLLPSFVTY